MHVWWGCHPSPHRHWMLQTHSPCLQIRQALRWESNAPIYHSDVYVDYLMYVLLQPITRTFFLAPISLAFAHIFLGVNIQKQSVNMRWGLRRFREHICKPLKVPHIYYLPHSHLHRPQQRTISLCCDEQQARLQILCNWILGSLGLPRNLFPWQLPNKTQPKNPRTDWSRKNSNPSSRRLRNHPSCTWNTIPYQILHLAIPEISLPQRKEETNKQGDHTEPPYQQHNPRE